jgi:hypothetical protein
LSGPSLDLIAPIRPSQLCADGGYQLRLGVLGVPLIMVPDTRCAHACAHRVMPIVFARRLACVAGFRVVAATTEEFFYPFSLPFVYPLDTSSCRARCTPSSRARSRRAVARPHYSRADRARRRSRELLFAHFNIIFSPHLSR